MIGIVSLYCVALASTFEVPEAPSVRPSSLLIWITSGRPRHRKEMRRSRGFRRLLQRWRKTCLLEDVCTVWAPPTLFFTESVAAPPHHIGLICSSKKIPLNGNGLSLDDVSPEYSVESLRFGRTYIFFDSFDRQRIFVGRIPRLRFDAHTYISLFDQTRFLIDDTAKSEQNHLKMFDIDFCDNIFFPFSLFIVITLFLHIFWSDKLSWSMTAAWALIEKW